MLYNFHDFTWISIILLYYKVLLKGLLTNCISVKNYYYDKFAGVYGDEPDKLVNGIPTTIEEYPHCVSLRVKDNNHFCCGSIIDPEYILTAGHCIVPLEQDSSLMESLTIVSGTTYLDNGGEVHKAAKVWLHENYNTRSSGRGPYDIGLIKVQFLNKLYTYYNIYTFILYYYILVCDRYGTKFSIFSVILIESNAHSDVK